MRATDPFAIVDYTRVKEELGDDLDFIPDMDAAQWAWAALPEIAPVASSPQPPSSPKQSTTPTGPRPKQPTTPMVAHSPISAISPPSPPRKLSSAGATPKSIQGTPLAVKSSSLKPSKQCSPKHNASSLQPPSPHPPTALVTQAVQKSSKHSKPSKTCSPKAKAPTPQRRIVRAKAPPSAASPHVQCICEIVDAAVLSQRTLYCNGTFAFVCVCTCASCTQLHWPRMPRQQPFQQQQFLQVVFPLLYLRAEFTSLVVMFAIVANHVSSAFVCS